MSFSTGIELNAGAAGGVRFLRPVLGLLGLYAVVSSTAEPGWIVAASCSLVLAFVASSPYLHSSSAPVRLVLRADGGATIRAAGSSRQAQLGCGNWSGRLCSVVELRDLLSGRPIRCLVCRSANAADDYRRLLVRLHSASSQRPERVERWL